MHDLGLPKEVKFCYKCVISNQRPRSTVEFKSEPTSKKDTIEFDDFGVCEACRFAQEKEEIDWKTRESELVKLLEKHRKNSGYDVIVPGSGGKDSAYTAHILKYKYGMNPLTVTWAPHLYTEIGWQNFVNWSHVGGFDNILFTPNGKLHRALTKEAFINLLHPFQPFIVGQRIVGPLFAEKFGVNLVFYGENQAEYGNSKSENLTPLMKKVFFENRDLKNIRLAGLPINQIISKYDFKEKEFEPYFPLQRTFVNVHYLGYYVKWDPQECFYYAAEHTGFRPAPERTEGSYSKYSSLDDKIDPFHYYTTLIKFGLGRASYDAAQEIRNGKITREDGINLVRQFDLEFPEKYFHEFLAYINLKESEFIQIIDSYRSDHLWEKRGSNWVLKNPIWSFNA